MGAERFLAIVSRIVTGEPTRRHRRERFWFLDGRARRTVWALLMGVCCLPALVMAQPNTVPSLRVGQAPEGQRPLVAFVFGTNPFGIEYDGQVMAEGQTGQTGGGGGGAGFNVNWDADWTVRAQITDRGWEAEFAIPLRTLRYNPGLDRTWGVNAMRNIRRKNEQVFLAPVPRGYNLYRVSVAGKLQGLSLPARRDIRFVPYAAGAVSDDQTLRTNTVDRSDDVGLDSSGESVPISRLISRSTPISRRSRQTNNR
jgi:hypothetical protein